MVNLTCFRIMDLPDGSVVNDLSSVVDFSEGNVLVHDVVRGPQRRVPGQERNNFRAQLFIRNRRAPRVPWAGLLHAGWPTVQLVPPQGPSALLVVRARPPSRRRSRRDVVFAFAFGTGGRHLLQHDAYRRGYGLKAALNLVYDAREEDAPRVRAVQHKRRGANVRRSAVQMSDLSNFDLFDVDRQRDVFTQMAGAPAAAGEWGVRVGGGESLSLSLPLEFDDLGRLCWRLACAASSGDYRRKFGWVDNVQPVTDPRLVAELDEAVLDQLERGDGLALAPPEVIDWDRVTDFRYYFDTRRRSNPVRHPDLRVEDLLAGFRRTGVAEQLTVDFLRSRRIFALDGDESDVLSWPIWKCLSGEVRRSDGSIFVLDEGGYFAVDADYLDELDAWMAGLATDTMLLPSSPRLTEGEYNERTARDLSFLCMDRQNVTISGRTTPVEVCDLLSPGRQLIHVKRHFHSAELSHLFSQGAVSAELLQSNVEFRARTAQKVRELAPNDPEFHLFDGAFTPTDFEVVYAVCGRWNGRTPAEALPFFSKVNLRHHVNDLRSRGYRTSLTRVEESLG